MQAKKYLRAIGKLTIIGFVLASFGCSVGEFISYKTKPDYPKQKNETIDMPGLTAEVHAYFDKAGVAHIEAENEADLLRAVGFIQARERFFQMDMMRRFARGRLCELVGEQPLLGKTTLDMDKSMRGWGFDVAAEEDAANIDNEMRALLAGYVEGVNYALSIYTPLEHRLLGVEPEPWKLSDSFALGRLTAWGISHNWHQELSRFLFALHGGISRSGKIYGHDYWQGGTTLPPEDVTKTLLPPVAEELKPLLQGKPYKAHASEKKATLAPLLSMAAWASNSWVIGGDMTKSGAPIVASDPHMAHFLPSVFFLMHIKGGDIDALGASIAGLPYILIGHNDDVAWGTTSAVGDVIDLIVEKTDTAKEGHYIAPDGEKPFEKIAFTIKVRDGNKMKEKPYAIRKTRNGAILNDMMPGLFPEWSPLLSIRWNMEGAQKSLKAYRSVNKAKTVEGLHKAFQMMTTPVSCYLAADKTGKIATFPSGTIPIRKSHRGTFPAPGWLEKYDWEKMADPEKMPFGMKKKGYYANGNNLMINPEHSRVMVNIDSAPSYRVDRISEMIEMSKAHDFDSVAEIQADTVLHRAKRILPRILADLQKQTFTDEHEKAALGFLQKWNYDASSDSKGALVFFVLYRQAIMLALEDELDESGFEFVLSQRYSTNVADLWFDDANHVVWDHRGTNETEKREAVVKGAFKRAVALIKKRQGEATDEWRWGRLHWQQFTHMFGSKKALAGFVNLPKTEAAGGLDSVWKSHFDLGHPKYPYRAMAGPSFRMIVDLADIKHGLWVIETGNSGWPGSPHYGDHFEKWHKGEFFRMVSDWAEIKEEAKGVLTLK